jgi:uncharacterized membrane protein YphA (DoxX/SURF4 family)
LGPVRAVVRWLIAAVFLYAGITKIVDPAAFAVDIDNYRLLPYLLVGATAAVLPWLEVICALSLLSGLWLRGSALLLVLLNLIFFLAIALFRRSWEHAQAVRNRLNRSPVRPKVRCRRLFFFPGVMQYLQQFALPFRSSDAFCFILSRLVSVVRSGTSFQPIAIKFPLRPSSTYFDPSPIRTR